MIDVHKNVTYNSHPVIIPYSCCNNIPENIHLPVLKPLKRSKLDVEGLKIAQRKLNQYSDELNKLLNQSFVSKHLNWITPLTITLIVMGVILYIICKYRRRRRRTTFPWIGIGITACNHKFPPSSPSQLKNTFMKQWKKIIPKRRPSINLRKHIEEDEETSLNLNKQKRRYAEVTEAGPSGIQTMPREVRARLGAKVAATGVSTSKSIRCYNQHFGDHLSRDCQESMAKQC
ncbi:hypothetical protein HUJ04_008256 [Dendroctonus ponderosae]|nr:hypothetical protein HUJ04_008256 [Dendroctonus ponderosae]